MEIQIEFCNAGNDKDRSVVLKFIKGDPVYELLLPFVDDEFLLRARLSYLLALGRSYEEKLQQFSAPDEDSSDFLHQLAEFGRRNHTTGEARQADMSPVANAAERTPDTSENAAIPDKPVNRPIIVPKLDLSGFDF